MTPSPFSRRRALQSAAGLAAMLPLTSLKASAQPPAPASASPHRLKLGVATYTFKQRPLGPTLAGIKRVGLSYCSIKDFHLPLKTTAEQRKEVADQFRAAGITPLSCGNISMNNEGQARQAFEYARDAGIPAIVCSPSIEVLPALDELVKEFDIRIAIHNHGPEDKKYPSPYDAMKLIERLDPRVGLCIDVGHTARAGVVPEKSILDCRARLYDVHMKDLVSTEAKAKPVYVGRGVLNIKGILEALLSVGFQGHVGFEHEIEMDDPLPGLAESAGFVKGVLAGLGA